MANMHSYLVIVLSKHWQKVCSRAVLRQSIIGSFSLHDWLLVVQIELIKLYTMALVFAGLQIAEWQQGKETKT